MDTLAADALPQRKGKLTRELEFISDDQKMPSQLSRAVWYLYVLLQIIDCFNF